MLERVGVSRVHGGKIAVLLAMVNIIGREMLIVPCRTLLVAMVQCIVIYPFFSQLRSPVVLHYSINVPCRLAANCI